MEISVIMSAYNAEKFIDSAIDSIIKQEFRDWELIIVDDASTDRTPEICRLYAEKFDNITVITNKTNQGAGMSRRIGINAATGKYIAMVDSDDWLDDNHLSSLYFAACEEHADIAWSGVTVHYENGSTMAQTKPWYNGNGIDIMCEMLMGNVTFLNDMLISRKLFNGIEYSGRRYVEDTPTLARLMDRACRVVTVPLCTYHYRQHGDSLCHKANDFKNALFKGLCAIDMWDYFCSVNHKFVADKLGLLEEIAYQLKKLFACSKSQAEAQKYINEWAEFTMRASCLIGIESTTKKIK